MLAQVRLVQGLVVDAGVNRHRSHALEVRDDLALALSHLVGLAKAMGPRKVHTTGIGGQRTYRARTVGRGLAQEADTVFPHHFDVAHHVNVRDFDEPRRAKELSDLNLLRDRLANRLSMIPSHHRAFSVGEFQAFSPWQKVLTQTITLYNVMSIFLEILTDESAPLSLLPTADA